jgi:hypothetical protein
MFFNKISEKIFSALKVSQKTESLLKALGGFAGVFMTVTGVYSLIVNNGLTSIEGIKKRLLIIDNRIEIQRILKKIGEETNSQRVLIFYYDTDSKKEPVTVFKSKYQWEREGQKDVFEDSYKLAKGGDTDRKIQFTNGECIETKVSALGERDTLGIALRKSNTVAQVACQTFVWIEGEKKLGAIAVEFESVDYDLTGVESLLLEASADVIQAFN